MRFRDSILQRSALPMIAALTCLAGQAAAQPEIRPDLTPEESGALLDAMAPTNAALVYYQALLQENKSLFEAYVHFNADSEDDGDFGTTREQAEEALIAGQGVLNIVAYAATLPECDFGIMYQNGWAALLPHLTQIRSVARTLDADAHRHLAAGDGDKAAERLSTMFSMARQVQHDRVLISSLVSIAISRLAHETARGMIESGELTEAGRDLLIDTLGRFDSEDPFSVRECIKMEGAITVGWIAKNFPDGHAGTELRDTGIFGDNATPQLVARLDAMNGPELMAEMAKLTDFYRQTLQVWSDKDSIAKLDALGAVVEAGGYGDLGKVFAPSLGRAREADLKGQGELEITLDALRAYRPERTRGDAAGETAPPTGR